MYIRTKENQSKHDKAVAFWAQTLIKNGWSLVRSDLPGNIKPLQIGNHIPDVYGAHAGKEIIIEIETVDSRNTDHTKLQLSTFQAWVNQSPTKRSLVIKIA